MSGILDPGDSRLVSRLLNDVNDPAPGVPLASSSASGSIIQPYYGLVGKRLVLTAAMAKALSDTAIGTLYEGIYQYVQTKAASTAAPARGCLCYCQDYENYIVTPDVSATDPVLGGPNPGLWAGVYISAPTKGNYCFIQIAGKASVQLKSGPTKTTPVMGDLVMADSTSSNKADVLVQSGNPTFTQIQLMLGTAINTPSSGAISLVDLYAWRQVFGGLGGF